MFSFNLQVPIMDSKLVLQTRCRPFWVCLGLPVSRSFQDGHHIPSSAEENASIIDPSDLAYAIVIFQITNWSGAVVIEHTNL